MSAMDFFWQQPPIARTVTATVLAVSLGVHLGLLPFGWIGFAPSYLLRFPPQVWRLVTAFCVTGAGISIVTDTFWLFQNLSQLETGQPRFPRTADIVWYLIFVASVIMILCSTVVSVLVASYSYFLPALSLAMAYTVTQDQRGQRASFFVMTVPAQLVPYCMILVNLFFPGGPMTIPLQITGLVAAHLFDFLSRIYPEFGGGPNLIPTPAFLIKLLAPPPRSRDVGSAGVASDPTAKRGPLPDSWRSRGPGRRLGE